MGAALARRPRRTTDATNFERFLGDFMFQLSTKAFENWGLQIVISKPGARMEPRRPPRCGCWGNSFALLFRRQAGFLQAAVRLFRNGVFDPTGFPHLPDQILQIARGFGFAEPLSDLQLAESITPKKFKYSFG